MAFPVTESGYGLFDMLSLLQKAIRRNDYEQAGFAANQLKNRFRTAMWNRIMVISSEDCYGIVTKELNALRFKDEVKHDDMCVARAVWLLAHALKSRDACYYACNFILANRKSRDIEPDSDSAKDVWLATKDSDGKDSDYFEQSIGLFEPELTDKEKAIIKAGDIFCTAVRHRDMDMSGFYADKFRKHYRKFLWNLMIDMAFPSSKINVRPEIMALKLADDKVNGKKTEKDEIFISKAIILLMQANDPDYPSVVASDHVSLSKLIDWNAHDVKPIADCKLETGDIPEWVFDCHTYKGKRMGKTDWDMTCDEQAALTPKRPAYFDDASWYYTYEQDFLNGDLKPQEWEIIKKYGETHEANPVKPY